MKSKTLAGCSLILVTVAIALLRMHAPILAKLPKLSRNLALPPVSGTTVPEATRLRIAENYGKLPLSFEVNQGQANGDVKFLSRGQGYGLYLTSNELVLNLNPSRDRKRAATDFRRRVNSGVLAETPPAHDSELPWPLADGRGSDLFRRPTTKPVMAESSDGDPGQSSTVRMKLVGANPSPQISGADELPGKSNYFIGNDRSKWRANVPNYAKVEYRGVYPGIDLVYYGNHQQLEYDFVVAPGADPQMIRFAVSGDEKPRIDSQGDLVLGSERSDLRLHRPVIYQEIGGRRQDVSGGFIINRNDVGFQVARYDASKPLVIDPILVYSTYFGVPGYATYTSAIAVDSSGDAYVTGSDFTTFQCRTCVDVFVAKLNSAGSGLEAIS